ncbi:MAG: hydrogenase 3 maturation endopeptidase HyCI [Candidatus Omnitrophica bacterium]|nr:hydrogenase 3 maturation endopeptidase HyCI [Candidatus Omnitrophota bacterium]
MAANNVVLNELEGHLKGRIVLVGMGNILRGDDAFGSLLAKRLEKTVPFKVLDAGTVPENFFGAVIKESPDTVLIVDAVDFGGRPGEFRFLHGDEVKASNLFATHNMSMGLLFSFIRENTKANVYLLAVQPAEIHFGEGMGPDLNRGLEELEGWFAKEFKYGKKDN